jgi:uncharacterized protein (TIGR03437 family)
VGLKQFLSLSSIALLSISTPLIAAPTLRLSATTVGPIVSQTGQSGPSQTIEAANAGDGTLSLSVTSNVPWASGVVGSPRPCTRLAYSSCIPITINFNTSALPAGLASGILTVRDPNATDAPQNITVLAQPGGTIPNRIDIYVPPDNRTVSQQIKTNSVLTYNIVQPAGGPQILFLQEGSGSFDFVRSYTLSARAPSGTGVRDYLGTVNITGSTFTGDLKAMQVNVKVTNDPIIRVGARVAPYNAVDAVRFRIMQNAAKQDDFVRMINQGLGTLNVASVTPSTTTGGNWLTAAYDAGSAIVTLTADASGLSPGTYNGKITIASNAANGQQEVPVSLEVVPTGPPVIQYQGVQENALFQPGDPVAPGGWAAVFGDFLSDQAPTRTSTVPLPAEVTGVRAFVNNRPAPILYTSAKQVNILIPNDTEAGSATVRIERNGQASNNVSVNVAAFAPRILRLGKDLPQAYEGLVDYGIAQIGGTNPVAYAIPPVPGLVTRAIRRGETLTLYGFGFGKTNPVVPDGALPPTSEPLARVTPTPRVVFGGSGIGGSAATVTPDFVGLIPIGLYQINVRVPNNTPVDPDGSVTVYVTDGIIVSNRVKILVQ